jgi:hypothetical protein
MLSRAAISFGQKKILLLSSIFNYGSLVPAIGFELMTYRLQGGCSTN